MNNKILKITDKYKKHSDGKYRKNRIFVLSKKLFNYIVNKKDRFSVKYIIDNKHVHINYNKKQITCGCPLADQFIQDSVPYSATPKIKLTGDLPPVEFNNGYLFFPKIGAYKDIRHLRIKKHNIDNNYLFQHKKIRKIIDDWYAENVI
tara:strand:- start:558 stop:1001 length:444 start_codon:yes stop_codon:yes gene_type:complete